MKIAKSTYITLRISLPLLQTLPSFIKREKLCNADCKVRTFAVVPLLLDNIAVFNKTKECASYIKWLIYQHQLYLLFEVVRTQHTAQDHLLFCLVGLGKAFASFLCMQSQK